MVSPDREIRFLDGSADLLLLVDGNPDTYQAWAENYYEIRPKRAALQGVYAHNLLTQEVLRGLKSTRRSSEIAAELEDISWHFPSLTSHLAEMFLLPHYSGAFCEMLGLSSSLHSFGTAPQSSARSFPAHLQRDSHYRVLLKVRSKWEETCHLMETEFFKTSC